MPSIPKPPSLTLLFASLFTLLLTQNAYRAQADTVVQDPLQAQANSFGWLAIRNFTYCMGDSPDPPTKPRGIQPKGKNTINADDASKKRLTGMGDSVVVLYHPENTNKAIAWCNTLVAFQSTEHVQCHTALPTCQRCDAVREKNGVKSMSLGGVHAGKGKAPSGKLGRKKHKKMHKKMESIGLEGEDAGLVALQKRDESKQQEGTKTGSGTTTANDAGQRGGADPNDPWIPGPDSETKPDINPVASTHGTTPRPLGSTTTTTADNPPDNTFSEDPELEAAISEFQDYCESKLTLAVRADCPLHLVKGWLDEPPFDLHRFCMALKGSDGYTLHTVPAPDLDDGGKAGGNDGAGKNGAATKGKPAAVQGGTSGGAQTGGRGDGGTATGGGGGQFDPNDPLVPLPDGGLTTTPPPTQPQPKVEAKPEKPKQA